MSKKKIILIIIISIILMSSVSVFLIYKNISINNIEIIDIDEHSIKLNWDSNNKEYKIIYSTLDSMKDSEIIITNDKNISINELLSNTDYYIKIESDFKLFNKSLYTYESNIINHHMKDIVLDEIGNLNISNITDNEALLTFDKLEKEVYDSKGNKQELSYEIYLKNNEEDYSLIDTISNSEYKFNNLNEFTEYSVKVLASVSIDDVKKSSETFSEVNFITLPSTIKNLKATSSSTSEIKLSWDKSKLNNVLYNVYGSDKKDGEYKLLSEKIKDNSYIESKLAENKTRYYYVTTIILVNEEEYTSLKSSIVSATTKKKVVVNNPTSSTNTTSSNSSSGTSNTSSLSEKDAQARKVAKEIASSITGSTDLDKITKAAQAVAGYASRGTYTMSGKDYRTAYGVFVKGEYSCAGTARALGLVLDYMGYKWKHINANQYTHQWVEVYNVDGETAWADGQIGMAGYGTHFAAG